MGEVKYRYRNTHSIRYERNSNATISNLVTIADGADKLGWKLDSSIYSEGLELDTEGITLHLVKFSDDKPEEFPHSEAVMMGIRIPTQSELRKMKPPHEQ